VPAPFDRAVQRRILEAAREAYPEAVVNPAPESYGLADNRSLLREVNYLAEHQLLRIQTSDLSGANELRLFAITARGIDFLADDGGLGAILGVTTVRLDDDTIKALLIREVEQSDESAEVKRKLIDQIKGLPAEGVKVLATEVLKAALKRLPHAMQWLHTLLSGPLS
jgi:hypothetical protein